MSDAARSSRSTGWIRDRRPWASAAAHLAHLVLGKLALARATTRVGLRARDEPGDTAALRSLLSIGHRVSPLLSRPVVAGRSPEPRVAWTSWIDLPWPRDAWMMSRGYEPWHTEPQRDGPVMHECSAYVGLDVHKDTIAVAVALPGREESVYRAEIKNQRKSLPWLIRSVSPNGEVVSCCYEAGPCGYGCIGRSSRRATIAGWWRRV